METASLKNRQCVPRRYAFFASLSGVSMSLTEKANPMPQYSLIFNPIDVRTDAHPL